MFEEGLSSLQHRDVRALDVVEILEASLTPTPEQPA
jgi:hypothetical protein